MSRNDPVTGKITSHTSIIFPKWFEDMCKGYSNDVPQDREGKPISVGDFVVFSEEGTQMLGEGRVYKIVPDSLNPEIHINRCNRYKYQKLVRYKYAVLKTEIDEHLKGDYEFNG